MKGSARAHAVFGALADPTRLRVLGHLSQHGPATATEIARIVPVSRQAVSKHLMALAEAGLVSRARAGREVRYSLESGRLGEIADWAAEVGRQWDARLSRLRGELD